MVKFYGKVKFAFWAFTCEEFIELVKILVQKLIKTVIHV